MTSCGLSGTMGLFAVKMHNADLTLNKGCQYMIRTLRNHFRIEADAKEETPTSFFWSLAPPTLPACLPTPNVSGAKLSRSSQKLPLMYSTFRSIATENDQKPPVWQSWRRCFTPQKRFWSCPCWWSGRPFRKLHSRPTVQLSQQGLEHIPPSCFRTPLHGSRKPFTSALLW